MNTKSESQLLKEIRANFHNRELCEIYLADIYDEMELELSRRARASADKFIFQNAGYRSMYIMDHKKFMRKKVLLSILSDIADMGESINDKINYDWDAIKEEMQKFEDEFVELD